MIIYVQYFEIVQQLAALDKDHPLKSMRLDDLTQNARDFYSVAAKELSKELLSLKTLIKNR